MAIVEWKDSMAIGVYNIDKQHKQLVALINDIAEAAEQGADQSALSRLIRRFFDYTMTHFRDEEALMDHETYPQYFQQVYEHLECAQKAFDFHARFMNQQDVHITELLDYIVPWFINHTTGLDQTLTPYLIGEGQKQL